MFVNPKDSPNYSIQCALMNVVRLKRCLYPEITLFISMYSTLDTFQDLLSAFVIVIHFIHFDLQTHLQCTSHRCCNIFAQVTVALANDYKTVQEMKALYDRMIRLENKCDKNRTDHVNETISYIQNHIERTSCYINTTRFTFPYQHPILDLPDGDLPVEFWNMTDTCETDDSNRHRNDYVIIVNTLNYTLSRSHYYSSVKPPYY